MDRSEQLAAYLSGDLGTDERRAIEAQLARDPALRARLEAIRRTDEILHSLPPVAPRAGFSDRLRREVIAEVQRTTGVDELGARRRRRAERGMPAWVPRVGAAAAGVALLATVGVAVWSLTGDGDEGRDLVAGGEVADSTLEAMAAPADVPVIVALDRSFERDELQTLLDDQALASAGFEGLSAEEARRMAERYAAEFGVAGGAAAAQLPTAPETGPEADTGPAGGAVDVPVRGEVTEEQLSAVQRCLPPLLADAGTVIPVYAELATFESEPAIVYGLVGNDPDTDRYSRLELWVVARDDCQVLHFTQD